jgi:uncharacterized protein
MIVVSNASPLIALAQADALFALKRLFERILLPESVRVEIVDQCRVCDQRQRIDAALMDFIDVAEPTQPHRFTRNLGKGERGVLSLALDRGADLLLMDDRKARNEADKLGLACAYTTDVLRLAEQRRIIPSAAAVIASLRGHLIFLPGIPPEPTDRP